MNFRTDLAIESTEYYGENMPEGVGTKQYTIHNTVVTAVDIANEQGAKKLGKPIGRYITADVSAFSSSISTSDDEITVLAGELRKLLPQGAVLVVGLGNVDITPDALGPLTVKGVLATRHISGEIAKEDNFDFRCVSVLAPGVLGQTGIETSEIIRSVVADTKPAAVIVIDALASRNISRLGSTIQMANSGISPGAGVFNKRKELSKETLGVPVVSMGIPTVVDATTLAFDLLQRPEDTTDEQMELMRQMFMPHGESMMVTPRDVDLLIHRAAKVLSMTINVALQEHLTIEDINYLVS